MENAKFQLSEFKDLDHSKFDENVLNIYRNRDFDDNSELKKNKVSLTHCKINESYKPKYDKFIGFERCFTKINDPNYYKLTENERLDKGLITKLDKNVNSLKGYFIYCCLLSFSIIQFFKIYSPSGIFLKAKHNNNLYKYFSYRIPLVFSMSLPLLYLHYYDLKRRIDYKSSNEIELDRKLNKILNKSK